MARILLISYNLSGKTLDRATMERKLLRDGHGADDVFHVAWGRRRERFALAPHIRGVSLRARFPRIRPLYDVLSVCAMPRVVVASNFRPEQIIVSDFALVWAAKSVARRLGGEVVLQLNGLPSHLAATRSVWHHFYARMHERLAWRFVDRYIAINAATRTYIERLGVSPRRITMRAPDTITPDLPLIATIQRGRARKRLGIGASEHLVLSVGRLEPEKAFDELIDVFAYSHIAARLVIAGEGKQRPLLEAQIKRNALGEHVVLAGQQTREQLWELYTDADAFVLISKSEALGLSVWEAMYAGVPVIGRPIGGIKESLGEDGERGFFWKSTDGASAFASMLNECFMNNQRIATMKERAYHYVCNQLHI